MATYVPKTLIGPAAPLTATPTVYVSGAGVNGIIRTISANAQAGSITLTVSLGADGAGTRIINAQALIQAQVFIVNGWWVTAANSGHAIDATSNATGNNCICSINGYEYS